MKSVSAKTLQTVFNCLSETEPKTIAHISQSTTLSEKTIRAAISSLRRSKEVYVHDFVRQNKTCSGVARYLIGSVQDAKRSERTRTAAETFHAFRHPLDVALFGEYRVS